MRWRYFNPADPIEAAEHAATLQRIDEWWAQFTRNTERLDALFRQQEQWDLPDWMHQHLQGIHPRLMWEFGRAINGKGHRLVITPESRCDLRPLVEDILSRAPDVDGWEFYPFRLAESLEDTLLTVEARCGLKLNNVTVAVSAGEHNRIDLTYRWHDSPPHEDDAFNAAFVATETLLGEQSLDQWVGMIQLSDADTPPIAGQHFLPLERLKPTFDAVVSSLCEQLPDQPYVETAEDAQWAVLKLQPQQAEDYPERYDMLTCVTCNPDLVAATFSPAPFYSQRFSRCGETFCYVKVDGSDLSNIGFEDREEMEDCCQRALTADAAGGLVGGGTGLRYSYMELALTHLENGIAAIRRALQSGNAPKRSWILFHDADLSGEWIGVYDDSPAPLMEDPEQE